MAIGLCLVAACAGSDELGDDDGGGGGGGGGGSGSGGGGGGGGSEEVDDTPPTYPTQHPRIYLTPNRARLEAALSANTQSARLFRTKVDQWLAGADLWGFQAWNAALLGQLTGNATYCAKAVATIEDQVRTAESAISSGSRPKVALDSYLEIGEMIGDLSLVYDWCFDQVTDAQRTRWIAYANQAVWNVWHHTEAKWGNFTAPWSGWSVQNPLNNYYYSFLRATMLLGLATKGENPQADTWIEQFRERKIMAELLPRFSSDLVGGGSREGTGYGVSMRRLFELYDFWKATTGEKLNSKTKHTRASMLAFMHQVVPTFDKVVPTGDHARDATATFFDYHRDYLQELMALYPNDDLSRRAKTLLQSSNVKMMSMGFMVGYDFLNDNTEIEAMPLEGLNTTYHAQGIGEIYTRSGWDTGATWVNLIAGPYTEDHAHQDQGSILIYKGGWLATDSNIFSRSGLSQATTSHSLVRIDSGGSPVKQVVGTISKVNALEKGDGFVYASADITPAYKNNAAIQMVQRDMVYLEPDVVVVYDRVQSASGTTQTWQLTVPVAPTISGNTATVTNAGHTLKVQRVGGASATMASYDQRGDSDLNGGYRIDQRVAGGDNRHLNVLSIDGAVQTATALGDTGVTLQLSNGHTAKVTFERDGAGAIIEIDGRSSRIGATVEALTEEM